MKHVWRSIQVLSLLSLAFSQKKDHYLKVESLYASSLFRVNQVLEGVKELDSLANVSSVSICLLNCMKRKPECKAFNWGDSQCVLLSDSVCHNETLLLTSKPGFAYYDIMDTPDYEEKHLKDSYCHQFGKCSGNCYPRTPHYVNTAMNKLEAKEWCEELGRTLPMPTNLDDQRFFESFAKKLLKEQPDIKNTKDMKFWVGISDELNEEKWMYDDESPVTKKFTAWAPGQPDNGGPYGTGDENCGALGEKSEFKWTDVNCNLKLKFFCA